jgi:hypothetical protein
LETSLPLLTFSNLIFPGGVPNMSGVANLVRRHP